MPDYNRPVCLPSWPDRTPLCQEPSEWVPVSLLAIVPSQCVPVCWPGPHLLPICPSMTLCVCVCVCFVSVYVSVCVWAIAHARSRFTRLDRVANGQLMSHCGGSFPRSSAPDRHGDENLPGTQMAHLHDWGWGRTWPSHRPLPGSSRRILPSSFTPYACQST